MKILAPSSALLLLVLAGCSNRVISEPPAEEEPRPVSVCEIDAECDPGEFCDAGVCAPVEVNVGDCASKADCGAGQVCLDGDCGAPPANCAHSEQCPDQLLCDGFSGVCFDPNATGCQSDGECRLEPGCEGGCACAQGSCRPLDPVDPVDPVEPGGDPILLDGYAIENREHEPAIQVGVLNGVSLQPGQILVIGRDATQAEFEAAWGVSFGPEVVYFNNGSSSAGVPVINGDETWALVSPSGTVLDDVSEPGDSGHAYQRQSAAGGWVEVPDAEATPGSVDLPSSGVGLVISEWSDASGSGQFHFEFIELYFAP